MAFNPLSIQPLGDRVLVQPEEAGAETVLASGIILAGTGDKERSARGTVIAIGAGKHDDGVLIPMTVKPGDIVLYSKRGDEVEMEGGEYILIAESSILAVISKD